MEPFGEAVHRIVQARPDVEILLPSVPHLRGDIAARAAGWPVRPTIVVGEAEKFAVFRRAHAALAASGTVTLELGLSGVPMVVAYRVEPLLRLLKGFLKLHSIVLANLALGENAIPEFLDEAGSPEALSRATLSLLADTPARAAQIAALARLDQVMHVPVPPSDSAARIVLDAAEAGPAWRDHQGRRRTGGRQSA
jgi:lipid-A-disaccharide synthase